MPNMLFNIRWEEGEPTVEKVCERYGLTAGDLDARFGVVEIDPDDHLYSILVKEEAAERLGAKVPETPDLEGPFEDARIAPFGPPDEP